jgi:DNA-binding MarR family transcriptional regulator
MLQKTPTGRDKRQLVYSMSQAGKKAIIEIDTAFADLSTRIFDRWTDEENNLLRILLNRLDKSIARVSKQ